MNNSQQKPIGRDHRGRLIYPGDMLIDIRNGQLATAYKAEYGKNDEYRVYWFNDSGVLINGVLYDIYAEVDLNLSPERTNYERYFADLGTLDQVVQCSDEICKQYDGKACTETSCPFCWWSLCFWADGPCLESFATWLEEEATI